VVVDLDELLWHAWVRPEDALEKANRGEWSIIRPTLAHLQWLRRWQSVEEAIRSARGADGRTVVVPRMVEDGSLLPILMPVDRG
jgi:hypothetical protein